MNNKKQFATPVPIFLPAATESTKIFYASVVGSTIKRLGERLFRHSRQRTSSDTENKHTKKK